MWIAPTLLLTALLVIGGVHHHAHEEMKVDVHSYCYNVEEIRKLIDGDY